MINYPITDETIIQNFKIWLKLKSESTGKSEDEIKLKLKQDIVQEIWEDTNLRFKIDGMCFRNNISKATALHEDIINEIVLQLMKYDDFKLITSYCDDYSRIFALAITIATRAGFGKLNKDCHPNSSLVKKALFQSNLTKTSYLSTTEEKIIDGEKEFDLPIINDDDLWQYIRNNLDEEDIEFLDFLLDKVLNKKYKEVYSRNLRLNYYSYNEYKIRRLDLQNKIKKIIKLRNGF